MQAEKLQTELILTLADFEAQAEGCMSPMAHGYIVGGAADELTLRANSEDWRRIRICPRVLVDVSEINLQTEVLGQRLELPLLLGPAAFHRLCHAQGERATVEGANQGGAAFVLSSFSTESV